MCLLSKVLDIQNKILQLSGGEFERLFDAYVYKKYSFSNIQTLGVQTGTNKPTKGTPDSYVLTDDGKYILITCGSVTENSVTKIKSDIIACFDGAKLSIEKEKIEKIICGHTSTNIHVEQNEKIRSLLNGIKVEPIGISTISYDLAYKYPYLAKDYLNISIDTNQIFDIDEFVSVCDKSRLNAPIGCKFWYREKEIAVVVDSVENNDITVVTGQSGVGKTRLTLEVCRQFKEKAWNVFCVKSNGHPLYDDLRCYIDNPGKYLVFFDDANAVSSFDNIMKYLLPLSNDYEIKVIATVRDYAKRQITNLSFDCVRLNEIIINEFEDEEIKNILKNNLGICNYHFLDRIASIANGNIRIAMLAGIKSVDGGYKTLTNVEDVYREYYGSVINDTLLTKEDLSLLCIIAISGPVLLSKCEYYKCLLNKYLPNINAKDLLYNLCELELVDWYNDEVVSISDQNMGDFILYYVLYIKKWLHLNEIIELSVPQYSKKIIYSLNTIMNKFSSRGAKDFVEQQIIEAWDNTCEDKEQYYLEYFYCINPIKSLKILKKFIDNFESTECILPEDEIEQLKKNNIIKTKEIEILSGYKYTNYYKESLELLFMYYKKCPDLFMDFYFAIVNRLLYDEYSYPNKYQKEALLLSMLWDLCDDGKNATCSLLYLHVVEHALRADFSSTKYYDKSKKFTYQKMVVVLSDDMKQIRSNIWNALFVLRENEQYRKKVNEIILAPHGSINSDKLTKEIIEFDFNSIYSSIEGNIDYINAKIIALYKSEYDRLNISIDDRLLRASENNEYRILNLLSRNHIIGGTIEDEEKILEKEIADEIEEYSYADFDAFFAGCENICKEYFEDKHIIEFGIAPLFKILETKPQKYKDILCLFFKHGAPANWYSISVIVNYLLNEFGYSKTMRIIQGNNTKKEWAFMVWQCLPEDKINEKIASEFRIFIEKNGEEFVPSSLLLSKFYKKDKKILDRISRILVKQPKAAKIFLEHCYNEKDITSLIEMFSGKEDVLCNIYISALGNHFDYSGVLFWRLYEIYPKIWNQYTNWIKEHDNAYYDYGHNIIKKMWNKSEYAKKIKYAFDVLLNTPNFCYEELVKSIFGLDNENNVDKKKNWLLGQLRQATNTVEDYVRLVSVVALVFPQWEEAFILEFLQLNHSVADFKNLIFFPSSSWSGSEIPRIDKEISFLEGLKSKIRGVKFIEHQAYLSDLIKERKKHKKRVEIIEYMENIS